MDIDTIFSGIMVIGSILMGAIIFYALNGDKAAQITVCVYIVLLISDKTWATRHDGFIYGFLTGLLK